MSATKLLESFKQTGKHVALVTVTDVMEAIVGEVPSGEKRQKKLIAQREDGSWLAEAFGN